MSTRTVPTHSDPPADDWSDDDGDFTPPPRKPRRRLVTPVTAVLAGVLIAALGFIGGVQVQKHSGSSTSSSATPTGLPNFARGGNFPSGAGGGPPTGAPGFGGGQDGNGTQGTVSYVKKGVLYVKDSDGNTVKVKVSDGTDVTRSAATTAGRVHPGDTVIVQGKKAGSTVTATSVTAIADGN